MEHTLLERFAHEVAAVLDRYEINFSRHGVMEIVHRWGHQQRSTHYAKGSVPVLLVAHLDTVHQESVKTICYSPKGDIIMSPEGIGGDDRAGVYMILQLIKTQHCHVLFCEDEEIGCVGAGAFVKSTFRPAVNYIVAFDRRGSKDAVFYDCDNSAFTKFVCGHGFVKEFGSFSDIAVVAPHLGIAAVNISTGYYNEHTRHECINLAHMRCNVESVRRMIEVPTEKFEYLESPRLPLHRRGGYEGARLLSPTPGSAYFANQTGDVLEYFDTLWVDAHGAPYEYFDEFGVAMELPGCSVFTEQGLPVRFDKRHAELVDIVSLEYICDCI